MVVVNLGFIFLIIFHAANSMPTAQNVVELIADPPTHLDGAFDSSALASDIETSSPSLGTSYLINDDPDSLAQCSPEATYSLDSFQKRSTMNACPNIYSPGQSEPNVSSDGHHTPDSSSQKRRSGGGNNAVKFKRKPACSDERNTPACCGTKNIRAVETETSVTFDFGICIACE